MSQWKPIETAPVDGTWIMAWVTPSVLDVGAPGSCIVCRFDHEWNDEWTDTRGYCVMEKLTGWMPLPAPPIRSLAPQSKDTIPVIRFGDEPNDVV